jgi:hypothetical protein
MAWPNDGTESLGMPAGMLPTIPGTTINVPGGQAPQVPTQPSSKENFIKMLSLLASNASVPQQGGGGMVSPAIVPQVAPSPQVPGMAAPPQGPPPSGVMQPISPASINPNVEFRTKQGAQAAMVQNAIGGISQFVAQAKQRKEQQTMHQAEVVSAMYLNAQQALQQNPNDEQARKIMQYLQTDKNAQKIMQKIADGHQEMFNDLRVQQPPEVHGFHAALQKILGKGRNLPQEIYMQKLGEMLAQRQQAQQTMGALQAQQDIKTQAQMKVDAAQAQAKEQADEKYAASQLAARPNTLKSVEAMSGSLDPDDRRRYLLTGELPKGKFSLSTAVIPGDSVGLGKGKFYRQWTDEGGKPIPGAYQEVVPPASQMSTVTRRTTTEDPLTGDKTTTESKTKIPLGQVAGANPKAGSALSSFTQARGYDREAQLAWWGYNWANKGEKPPSPGLQRAVGSWMRLNGLEPGIKVPAQRLSSANTLLNPPAPGQSGLIDHTIDLIRQNRSKLGVFRGRVSEFEKRLGSVDPDVARIYSDMKSIYSLAGSLHGWRALKVADEFEKAFGGLSRNPDALIASMEEMKKVAQAVAGSGAAPGGANRPAPTAGATGTAKNPQQEADEYLKSLPK